jgi:hypothetical protein
MPEAAVEAMVGELKSTKLFTAADLRAIERGNAMKLFARD